MTWAEVLAVARQGGFIYYHAPMDYRPTRVRLTLSPDHPEEVRVLTPLSSYDFWADRGHLSRFSKGPQ